MIWIEGTSEDGSNWSARWSDVSDEQADRITHSIEQILNRPADTTCDGSR